MIGIDTWLMHGTLLGWWWGQKGRMPSISLTRVVCVRAIKTNDLRS